MRALQRRQLQAYDVVRVRVGQTLSVVSETVMGAAVVRAYGIAERVRSRLSAAIDRQYRAELRTAKYFAFMFPLGDVFGGLALASVIAIGVWWGPGWGMQSGTLIAFAFLVNLLLIPVAELGEILDQTQTAMAGWRKVLDLLDVPVDIVEPEPGVELPAGSADLAVEGLEFAYRDGGIVLRGVDVTIPAGTNVAVVGETGLGQDDVRQAAVPAGRPDPGPHPDRRRRPARRVAELALRRHPDGAPGRLPVRRRRSPRTCAWVDPTPPTPRWARPSCAWASTGGWPGCPPVSTPRWASGARTCRWGSASSWRWPGPSSPIPAC